MNIEKTINAFYQLRDILLETIKVDGLHNESMVSSGSLVKILEDAIKLAEQKNPWFTHHNILFAIKSITDMIRPGAVENWLIPYRLMLEKRNVSKKVGVVMAGNIPLVGFHDFFSVLISGNRFVGKLSVQDDVLMLTISDILVQIEPSLKYFIEFRKDKLDDIDAVIATGSNNTSRYFEYYFSKYPNIIRRNRNSVAVLTGLETREELHGIADDIMIYFGLGCRNVSRLFIPEGYDLSILLNSFENFAWYFDHNKYRNNYDYYKAIFLINSIEHKDNGFLLMKEDMAVATPVSVVYYSVYKDVNEVESWIDMNKDKLQCVVSKDETISGSIRPGTTQKPALNDYSDGIDTMAFLSGI